MARNQHMTFRSPTRVTHGAMSARSCARAERELSVSVRRQVRPMRAGLHMPMGVELRERAGNRFQRSCARPAIGVPEHHRADPAVTTLNKAATSSRGTGA